MSDCHPTEGMSRERFQAYIDAFNRNDPAYGDYYDEDVVLVIAGKTELRGPRAIHDFYTRVKTETRRTIQVNRYLSTPEQWAYRPEIEAEFARSIARHGPFDVAHLRFADVGTFAAARVFRRLGVPVVFTLAPDPHSVLRDGAGKHRRVGTKRGD